MRTVKMLRLEAGPKGTFDVGEVREVSNVQADALVAGGYAEFLREPPEMETTVDVAAEEREMTVATPKPRRKAKRTVKKG